jgi:hypothetical protein
MPLVQTRGAASAQGFGEFAQAATAANYIEDVFSTYLYTGNGTSQTINNGLDLNGKGGLTWIKARTAATYPDHWLWDTARQSGGNQYALNSNTTGAQQIGYTNNIAWTSTGFDYSTSPAGNQSGQDYCSWSFREQAKFFDIVTFTGNGVTTGRTINHNLGSAPGMMILKVIDLAGDDWYVYHRSIPTSLLALNLTNGTGSPPTTPSTIFGNGSTTVAPTSTQVTIGGTANSNGYSYVLYLFAHDAGGFGTAGTDNVISCGTFTTDASGGYSVTLGYEAQYVLLKRTDGTGDWLILDVMRGAAVSADSSKKLRANTAAAEVTDYVLMSPKANGFYADSSLSNLSGSSAYIYMAIRRPMKVPTTGTSVFSPQTASGVQTTGFVVDAQLGVFTRSSPASYDPNIRSRLTGGTQYLVTSATDAEAVGGNVGFDSNTGMTYSWPAGVVNWYFSRRPGFFDVVCYTGTGSATTQTHNLTVVPELMIVKKRSASADWQIYLAALANTEYLVLNTTAAKATGTTRWNSTTPTTSAFTIGTDTTVNASGATYVAYLFATCAGVSKVGSYTGNGSTQAIACGFTGGARFVLIKRTDATGGWYVYDTARGMTLLTDPYLFLNSTAAEAATLGSVTTTTGGFTVDAAILAAINTSSATYIFLAIA